MKMVTKMGALSLCQFGSRSGHNALGQAPLKRLLCDAACLLVALICTFDCDASEACFNGVIPSQCMMLGRQTGIQGGLAKLRLKAPERASEALLHQGGLWHAPSPHYFATTLLLLILGMMHGSTAIGAFWALSSSLLLAALQR